MTSPSLQGKIEQIFCFDFVFPAYYNDICPAMRQDICIGNMNQEALMITIEKTLDLPDTYPLERIGSLDKLLFFDIETTGFSALTSRLYLIGCTYFSCGQWQLIQWFADSEKALPELLYRVLQFL